MLVAVKMINPDGQKEKKWLEVSRKFSKHVKLPMKSRWTVVQEDVALRGQAYTTFFLMEAVDLPYEEMTADVTVLKCGYALVYAAETSGFVVSLADVTSFLYTAIGLSERALQLLEKEYVGIQLLWDFGKAILLVEDEKAICWLEILDEFVPCAAQETSLSTVDLSEEVEQKEEKPIV